MAKELKRLNMNMPAELIEQVDAYADSINVNRSSAINMLVSFGLMSMRSVGAIEKLVGQIDELKAREEPKR